MEPFAVTSGAPILSVTDFDQSLDFYTSKLGFRVQSRYDDPPFAILDRGTVKLALAEEGHASEDRPGIEPTALKDPSRPQVMLVLWVDDCPAVYEKLTAEGVEFKTSPVYPPWGGSRCYAVDPDGYLVEIEQLGEG